MKKFLFVAVAALSLSGCAVPYLAVIGDGIQANERGTQSYVAKGIQWACDKIGGTYATDGSGDCNKDL